MNLKHLQQNQAQKIFIEQIKAMNDFPFSLAFLIPFYF